MHVPLESQGRLIIELDQGVEGREKEVPGGQLHILLVPDQRCYI